MKAGVCTIGNEIIQLNIYSHYTQLPGEEVQDSLRAVCHQVHHRGHVNSVPCSRVSGLGRN